MKLLVWAVCVPACVFAAFPWPPEFREKGNALAAAMDFDSLINETTAHAGHWEGTMAALPAYGVPGMGLEDGPQGVAGGMKNVTCFPSAMTMACGWDLDAAAKFGDAIGQEQHGKGTTVMLGPAVNIARIPWNGRLWEYLGEDPMLAGALAATITAAVQNHNISACLKHYVLNVQEENRFTVSSNVDRRTAMEVYYPPFIDTIEAGVASVMCSYNRINGTHACENNQTQVKDLREKFGFDGWIRSDGGALVDTVASALNGCDQEMPRERYYGAALAAAVKDGQVPEAQVRKMMSNLFTGMYASGIVGDSNPGQWNATVTSPAHAALARSVAANSAVLLKNTGLLPLDPTTITSLAVFGDVNTVTGEGSGGVIPPYIVSPAQGLQAALPHVTVTYCGDSTTAPSVIKTCASAADVVVVVLGMSAHEGFDRTSLDFPDADNALVTTVLSANIKTIVNVRSPGPCLMPWLPSVPAVLFSGLPGQEAGNALADNLIKGGVTPSGKLILSFPTSMNNTWLSTTPGGPINPEQYPGTDRGRGFPETDFTEGLFYGYKWFDHMNIQPLFPFGFGLSYTSFSYSNLTVTSTPAPAASATVSLTVTNTGAYTGAEIVQVYVAFPPAANEPPQLLKGFAKTAVLAPNGGSQLVTVSLSTRSFSVFDVVTDDWTVIPGQYILYVSASSRDVRLQAKITL